MPAKIPLVELSITIGTLILQKHKKTTGNVLIRETFKNPLPIDKVRKKEKCFILDEIKKKMEVE